MEPPSSRLAIPCLRLDLSENLECDQREMTRLGVRLGYAVDEKLVVIDPFREGPFTTVWLALQRTKADAVIVPTLEHVDGIERWIRLKAQIITVNGEKTLERDRASIECEALAIAPDTLLSPPAQFHSEAIRHDR